MMKKSLFVLLLTACILPLFARTKAEILKELAPIRGERNGAPFKREWRDFEQEILLKDQAYKPFYDANAKANKDISNYIDSKMKALPGGPELLAQRDAVLKKLTDETEDKVAVAKEQREINGKISKFAAENKITNWRTDEYRNLEMTRRTTEAAKMVKGMEILAASNNEAAKIFGRAYLDNLKKIDVLEKELKDATE